MMADRGLTYAVAALGISILLAGGAGAEEVWQRYAPRCQPSPTQPERALCEQHFAVFGLAGPQVIGRGQGMDVEATGSIGGSARDSDDDRARL